MGGCGLLPYIKFHSLLSTHTQLYLQYNTILSLFINHHWAFIPVTHIKKRPETNNSSIFTVHIAAVVWMKGEWLMKTNRQTDKQSENMYTNVITQIPHIVCNYILSSLPSTSTTEGMSVTQGTTSEVCSMHTTHTKCLCTRPSLKDSSSSYGILFFWKDVNILHFPSSLKSLQHIPTQPPGSPGTGHFNCVWGVITFTWQCSHGPV